MVKMPVDVEVGRPTVLFAADEVGKSAQAIQVGCAEKREPVVERKPFARFNFLKNSVEIRIEGKRHT